MRIVILLALVISAGTLHAQTGPQVGDTAPTLQKPSAQGPVLELHTIHADLILLDFWAGWCKPCLKTIKSTLRPLYNKYDRSQLEIVGISYDKSEAKWRKAIEKLDLPWKHVYDANDNELLKKYAIDLIPTYYLVDKTGKIVGKNILSAELGAFVDDYLSKNSK